MSTATMEAADAMAFTGIVVNNVIPAVVIARWLMKKIHGFRFARTTLIRPMESVPTFNQRI
jgi:hypothetical protein